MMINIDKKDIHLIRLYLESYLVFNAEAINDMMQNNSPNGDDDIGAFEDYFIQLNGLLIEKEDVYRLLGYFKKDGE